MGGGAGDKDEAAKVLTLSLDHTEGATVVTADSPRIPVEDVWGPGSDTFDRKALSLNSTAEQVESRWHRILVTTVDSVVNERVHFMKIGVNGFEQRVLRG